MDNFIRGTYSDDENGKFKGCAVGCSLESIARTKKLNLHYGDHLKYPELLGIPEWLARVEDTIFENISKERSKSWPVEFAEAIPENVDLQPLKSKFLICVLDKALTAFDHEKFPDVKKSIDDVKLLWVNGGTEQEFRNAAADAARAAATQHAQKRWNILQMNY